MGTSPFAEEVWIFLEVSQVWLIDQLKDYIFNVCGLLHNYK